MAITPTISISIYTILGESSGFPSFENKTTNNEAKIVKPVNEQPMAARPRTFVCFIVLVLV